MHFNPTVFLVYALSGSLLGILSNAEPLIGATVSQVEPGEYNFVVSIAHKVDNIRTEETHICTGSLIKNNVVLTAAHCLKNLTPEGIKIFLGKVDLRDARWYNASTFITYNQWAASKNIAITNSSSNDIAIIKLADKVHGATAKPVTLSYKKINDPNDELVVLAGWGLPSENSEISSRYLRKASVSVLSREDCQGILYDLYQRNIAVGEKYICTRGYPVAVLAPGDSGGPVLRNNSLVGVNTRECVAPAFDCTIPRYNLNRHRFNLHHSIAFYKEFITDVMKH